MLISLELPEAYPDSRLCLDMSSLAGEKDILRGAGWSMKGEGQDGEKSNYRIWNKGVQLMDRQGNQW